MKSTKAHRILVVTLVLFCGAMHGHAQSLPNTPLEEGATLAVTDSARTSAKGKGMFSIVATVAAGYTRYINPYTSQIDIDRNGAAFSGRLLWHPDHRLLIGLESGWTRFYSYDLTDVETSFGLTDASLSLSAVPMLLVFAMPLYDTFTLYGGAGGYLVHSRAESFGVIVDVDRFSQGWMAAATWDRAIASDYRLGLEVKWYGATEFGDGIVALQAQVQFTLMSW